jgi:hypothetical protein
MPVIPATWVVEETKRIEGGRKFPEASRKSLKPYLKND